MPGIRRWRAAALSVVITLSLVYYFYKKNHITYLPFSASNLNDGKVHWKKLTEQNTVSSIIPLPTGVPKSIPDIQTQQPKEDAKQLEERMKRKAAILESFTHSWEGYKQHAWLRDEVAPLTGKYKDTFGGWAATLVDSLDTLWIMGMKTDFELAVRALGEIDFTTTDAKDINVFETTIRYMGGFLAAYDISGAKYPLLLTKAIEVGELLMCCFDTPNRMPITRWDWKA
jgi:mannosyl-oligosaccharide alpha-1,2-mannosidase